MTPARCSARAPGKLYLAGEYAVVEPGHRAVLVAVDRFLTVTVAPASGRGRISSPGHATGWRSWGRPRPDGPAEADDGAVDYVVSAIRHVEELVRERGAGTRLFDVEVVSELDDPSGRKLGLGSSSAVTVATVRAVAGLYGLDLDDTSVYKLAMLASDAVEPIGSGGDLAAATLTGWVSYASPDRQWLRRARRERSCAELLSRPWPGLALRRLRPPGSVRLRVGWTGRPASTPRLVAGVRDRVHRSGATGGDEVYASFLRSSQTCLEALTRALEDDDARAVGDHIRSSRRLLADLALMSGTVIETPLLARLVRIAEQHGAAAKSSGAGGGDCGIALCPPSTQTQLMCRQWRSAGIRPLDLSVHTRTEEDS